MLLHRFTFINVTVRHLAPFANSRALSGFSSKREKPKHSGFLLERNNCIFGVRSRKLGLWNPPISMCGPEEIQLQVFTRNLRPRNERHRWCAFACWHRLRGLCKVGGRLSYPLYMTHYPIMFIYANWVETRHHTGITNSTLLCYLHRSCFFAWVAAKFFDEPIRTRLRRYSLQKRNVQF